MRLGLGVLLYGNADDCQDYAIRCLTGLAKSLQRDAGPVTGVRLGLNVVGLATRSIVLEFATAIPPAIAAESWALIPTKYRNAGKYPLMRRMIYGSPGLPALTDDRFLWSDDDSAVVPEFGWSSLSKFDHDLVGFRYHLNHPYKPSVAAWVRRQRWYRGTTHKIDQRFRQKFAQGGWWMANLAKLRQWDYPFPELHHNGGDYLLGALAEQQAWRIRWLEHNEPIYKQVIHNASLETKAPSSARRRGMTTPHPGETRAPPQFWHDFDCRVVRLPELKLGDFDG